MIESSSLGANDFDPEEGGILSDLRVVFPDAGMELDLSREELRKTGGDRVDLRPQSFQVLRLLAINAGRVVSKSEIHDKVWGEAIVTDDSLVQVIHNLREVLGDHDHRMIRTVPRQGYELVAGAVQPVDVNSAANKKPAELSALTSSANMQPNSVDTGTGMLRRNTVWLAVILILGIVGGLTWFQLW